MRCLLLMLVTLWPALASATDYYVAKTGSDGNTGTSTSVPWLTVGKCASTIVAGDRCIIRAGTYDEIVNETSSGTNDSTRITYENYPGETPIIRNTTRTPSSGHFNDYVFQMTGNYVSLIGLEIQGGQGQLVYINGGNNNRIASSHLHDCTNSCVYIWTGTDNVIEDNTIHEANPQDTTGGNSDCISFAKSGDGAVASRVTIRRNTIYRCADDGIDLFWGTNNTIERNKIYTLGFNSGNGNGMKLGHGGINTVRNNFVGEANNICFTNNEGPSNVVLNNTARNCGLYSYANYAGGFGTGAGAEYRNNIASGTGSGVLMDVSPTQQTNSWNLSLTCTFLSTTAGDTDYLKPAATSPCLEVGTTLGSFSNDLAGTTRPQGTAWDLGAYEYVDPPTNVTGTTSTTTTTGGLVLKSVTQANLGTPGSGTVYYCSDCTIANPCAGSGTGAIAKRLNSVWVCN